MFNGKIHHKDSTGIEGEEGLEHCWINQNTIMSLGLYDEAQTFSYSLNPVNKCLFLFVMEGKLSVHGQEVAKRGAIGIWDTTSTKIKTEANTEFLLIETPIDQKQDDMYILKSFFHCKQKKYVSYSPFFIHTCF